MGIDNPPLAITNLPVDIEPEHVFSCILWLRYSTELTLVFNLISAFAHPHSVSSIFNISFAECAHSAKDILNMLLTECGWANAEIRLNTKVSSVEYRNQSMQLNTCSGSISTGKLVIASGGLSIPTMGP